MNNLLAELEKYQVQFSDYGTILLKIMLQKKEGREYALKYLIDYLKVNPEVNIVDLKHETKMTIFSEEEPQYTLVIKFKCSVCKNVVREEIGLRCTWFPRRTKTDLICQICIDQYDDQQYNAQEEQRYLEEEEMRNEKDHASDSSDLKKDKHEKN